MLPRTILVTLSRIQAETLENAANINEIMKYALLAAIGVVEDRNHLRGLHMTYNYKPIYNYNAFDYFNGVINTPEKELELMDINHLIMKMVEDSMWHFYLHTASDDTNVLNFNTCAVNKSTWVITAETLKKESKYG